MAALNWCELELGGFGEADFSPAELRFSNPIHLQISSGFVQQQSRSAAASKTKTYYVYDPFIT